MDAMTPTSILSALGITRSISQGTGKIIALVGGGGKTTLAFNIAMQAAGSAKLRVVVTTTTKMMLPHYSRIRCGSVELSGDCPVVLDEENDEVIEKLRSIFAQEADSDAAARGSFAFLASKADPDPRYQGRRCIGIDPRLPRILLDAGVCDLVVVEADGFVVLMGVCSVSVVQCCYQD